MLTTELVERVLAAIPNRTVGVLGDLFLDRYLDIDPALDEPSVETGLTAYQVTRVRSYPGALGTVVNNEETSSSTFRPILLQWTFRTAARSPEMRTARGRARRQWHGFLRNASQRDFAKRLTANSPAKIV